MTFQVIEFWPLSPVTQPMMTEPELADYREALAADKRERPLFLVLSRWQDGRLDKLWIERASARLIAQHPNDPRGPRWEAA